MRTITINGRAVRIPVETMKRIERVANRKRISIAEAIQFCLQKVI